MSLSVKVYTGKFGTKWEILKSDIGDDLAGSESHRKELWGSPIIKTLDLQILPTLEHSNIFVDEEQLLELESEVKIVQQNANIIAANAPIGEYSISVIANNIMKAISRAKDINGGVLIW